MDKSFDHNFLNINSLFWNNFREPDIIDGLVLVEVSTHPVINHANAVVGKIIAYAKNLRIAWLESENINKELMLSYSKNSLFVKFSKVTFFKKMRFFLFSIFYYLRYIFIVNRIHAFKYKGIPYGDFIYDGYLAVFSMVTLHRFDVRLTKIFYILLLNDAQARVVLSNTNIKAILVSHYMGLSTGPLSRIAMQKNIPVYWKGGGHGIINFCVFKDLKQIYDYPLKPTSKEIETLIEKTSEKVEADFQEFISQINNNPYYGIF